MKAWSLFYPDVLPELPGAPVPMVDHWLRNAAIEFCERSKAHVVTLDPITSVADQMAYVIALDADTELVELVAVRWLDEKLTPKSPHFLEEKYDDWESETGTPEHYTQVDTENVMLVPAPGTAETDGIRIRAAIKPGIAATGVHDWLFSQYRPAICAGAKAKMMAQLDKPWSKPDLVAINQAAFDAAIDSATTRASDGHVRSTPRFSGSFC